MTPERLGLPGGILLNQPWRIYDRQAELERRRLAVCRSVIAFIYWAAGLVVGIAVGMLIRH